MRRHSFFSEKNGQQFMILAIMLLAVYIRARLNFHSPLLPGVNGGYYALMTRALIETGQLPFSDFPLSFWLLRGLAALLGLFGMESSQAILLSCKLADSILPVLAAIPVWLLARKKRLPSFPSMIMVGLVILYFPSSYLLTGELFKNALGVVWLTTFLAALAWFQEKPNASPLAWATGAFIFLALTHFGSLLTGLLFLPLLFYTLWNRFRSKNNTHLLSLTAILLLFLSSPDAGGRLARFLSVTANPLRLFEHPVLFYWLNSQQMFSPFITGFLILSHLLASILLVLSIYRWKAVWWFAIAWFLSNPMIGLEWYLRLAIMAHIPFTIGLMVLWNKLGHKEKAWLTVSLSILILVSVFLGATGRKRSPVTRDDIRDFLEIKQSGLVQSSDLVLAAHGVEWWTAWFLDCHIAQPQAVTLADTKQYETLYGIKHVSGEKPVIQRGQLHFLEPEPAHEKDILFQGNRLILFKIDPSTITRAAGSATPLTGGRIQTDENGEYYLDNGLLKNPLVFKDPKEKASLDSYSERLVQIYGHRKAFSLQIEVDSISGAPPGN